MKKTKARQIFEKAYHHFKGHVGDHEIALPQQKMGEMIADFIEKNPHQCSNIGIRAVCSALYVLYVDGEMDKADELNIGSEWIMSIFTAGRINHINWCNKRKD